MKKFFTTTFACVLGVMIAGILLTLLSIAALTGMAVSTETEYTAKPNTIMKLDLGIVTDRSQEDFMSVLFGNQQKTDGLDNIIKAIKTAKTNPNIAGIYIDANGSSLGVATLDRIHRALKDFKESDKFIYAYADDYTQREYLLSAVADSVVLNPVGAIDFRGLASQIMFVKGLYDKLGIEVQVLKVGTYKSAVEPYINTQMSESYLESSSRTAFARPRHIGGPAEQSGRHSIGDSRCQRINCQRIGRYVNVPSSNERISESQSGYR